MKITAEKYNLIIRLLNELRKKIPPEDLLYSQAIEICIGIVEGNNRYKGCEWFFPSQGYLKPQVKLTFADIDRLGWPGG